jgi:hypothetical protein
MIKPLHNEKLPVIMHWIFFVFALHFNKLKGYRGHVWKDRYHSTIISDQSSFNDTFQYISNLPVHLKAVINHSDYRYGGIFFFMKKDYRFLSPPDSTVNQMLIFLK